MFLKLELDLNVWSLCCGWIIWLWNNPLFKEEKSLKISINIQNDFIFPRSGLQSVLDFLQRAGWGDKRFKFFWMLFYDFQCGFERAQPGWRINSAALFSSYNRFVLKRSSKHCRLKEEHEERVLKTLKDDITLKRKCKIWFWFWESVA